MTGVSYPSSLMGYRVLVNPMLDDVPRISGRENAIRPTVPERVIKLQKGCCELVRWSLGSARRWVCGLQAVARHR